MNENTQFTILYRWFWPWQDEEEENWLTLLASKGFHLIEPGYFGRYKFHVGTPAAIQYRLDFHTKDNNTEAQYIQFFTDTGWEHVGTLGGWYYFRKEIKPDEVAEIFTDNRSKAEKYKRVLLYLLLFLPIYMILLTRMDLSRYGTFGDVVNIIFIGIVLLYSVLIVKILLRLRVLTKKS